MNYLSAVDYCFADLPGGMGRVAWDAAVAMRDHGYQVTVLCMPPGGTASRPLPDEHDGIRIVRYQRPHLPAWHPRRADRTIAAAAEVVRNKLAGVRWDIVHMHSPLTGAGVMKGLGPGPRYVYTMHSPFVLEQRINWAAQGIPGKLKLLVGQGKLRRIERQLLDPCAAIQTLSEYTRSQIERFHGLGSRVTVIPHWRRETDQRALTRDEARDRLGWSREERILFTVRRHGPRYGLDLAIRAAVPLLGPFNARLVLAGDGELRPHLEALARQSGASERIVFTGYLSDEQLRWAYQAADLFLLPTLALECFGLIILESFSFGCPVLSSDVCAIPETMQPIMPEFVFRAGDVDALHRKLHAFLSGELVPPRPEKLIAYVESRFGYRVVLPQLLRLLTGQHSTALTPYTVTS